ncbi:MAG: ATP-binding protein, partial [Bacteroidales bacterium]|nr:ATP-binding protein [Bacteroidales bacterium]
ERVWGRKREKLLEDPMAMVQWVHPDDRVEMEPWVNLSQFQSQLTYVEQFRIIKPDGNSCWVWVRLYPLRNAAGEVDRVIGIASDINELKKFEEALLEAKEKAQESDKLKSVFLANISHEIRTPMNGIVGFAELVTRPELNDQMKKSYVNLIKQSSEQLVRIIDDIIDISKIESNLIELKNEDFNLNKLISDTEILFQRSLGNARNTALKLMVNKPMSDDDAMVKGDKMRIQQVLNNLLNNAIKYTPDGSIEFGYQIEKDMVLFSVRDTGIGIPQSKQDVIFGHFRQVDEGHTRKFGGTGLGLSISKGLVNLMGGDIWFNSTKGEGSSFYFTIPYIRVKSKVGVSESTHNITGYNWEGKTILVAEDDKLNFEFIKAILTPTMATVVRASNGSQVIKLCNTVACDIILMDIRLPIYNGLEATKRIREKGITTPIIAQTAYAYEDDRNKCLAAGCDDYITKPIRKDLMLRKIDRFFEM